LHQNLELSDLEAKYLDEWRKSMQNSATLVQDCLVPTEPSSYKLSDLSPEDIFTLNSIPRVKLDRD